MKYYYKQGNKMAEQPIVLEPNNSCLSAFISAIAWVICGVVSFLLVYYGWIYLIRPLIHEWATFMVY